MNIINWTCSNEIETVETDQNRTEQNRTEQNRTEQNRTEQNRTESLSHWMRPRGVMSQHP